MGGWLWIFRLTLQFRVHTLTWWNSHLSNSTVKQKQIQAALKTQKPDLPSPKVWEGGNSNTQVKSGPTICSRRHAALPFAAVRHSICHVCSRRHEPWREICLGSETARQSQGFTVPSRFSETVELQLSRDTLALKDSSCASLKCPLKNHRSWKDLRRSSNPNPT